MQDSAHACFGSSRTGGRSFRTTADSWPTQPAVQSRPAAATDRAVHHPAILELDVPGYRTGLARRRGQDKEVNRQEQPTPTGKSS